MTLPAPDSTLVAIRRKVRHLTNSPNENNLTTAQIDEYINDIYQTDFPYAIKIDQMRSVYTFYTEPYRDRYPLDVNFNQGVRSPVFVDGIQAGFYKDRNIFFNVWPRFTTLFQITPEVTSFTFNIPGPFLSNEVTIGGINSSGGAISIRDDGQGNLNYLTANPQTFVPTNPPSVGNPAIPGMANGNLGNPGLYTNHHVGTVNYVTGDITIDFSLVSVTPDTQEQLTVRVSQYQPGKPGSLLFWNNELTVRPVPKKIHKVEVETYLTPVQFLASSDHPIINQWWKYLAYITAAEISRERNDFDAVKQLQEGAMRQEALVLERQGIEEIGTPTPTMFNSPNSAGYLNNFWGQSSF